MAIADGQLAASLTAMYTGANQEALLEIILQNTSASLTEAITLTLTPSGSGVARRLASTTLAPNQQCIVQGCTCGIGDILKGTATDATTVDYLINRGTGPFTIEMKDAIGQDLTSVANNTALANTITSASATALVVGANGTSNPQFTVDDSTSSVATGIKIKGAAAAGGVAISVTSSAGAEALKIDALSTGSITIGSVSTGNVILGTSGHTLTLNNSTGAVTLAAGGLTLTSGAIVVTSGNVTMTAGNLVLTSGTYLQTSTSATAHVIGPNGATNPTLKVVCSVSSQAGGLSITGGADAVGVALAALGSNTNEPLLLDAKGSGVVTIGSSSTGGTYVRAAVATVAATGTVIGNAAAVTEGYTYVTGSNNVAGIQLPTSVVGKQVTIKNTVSTALLLVYPPALSQINAKGVNNVFNTPNAAERTFTCVSSTLWYSQPETIA